MIGDKLGLYRALADLGPTDAAALADATGCDARLVQEWLDAQYVSGYCHFSAQTATLLAEPRTGRRARRPEQPGLPRRQHDDRRVDRQGRGEGPRGVPNRQRPRLARAPPRPVPRHRAAVQARLRRQPGLAVDPGPRRRRREARPRRLGRRPRLRARRLVDPARPGLPAGHDRRLRLPPGLDRRRPQARRRGGCRRSRPLRGRRPRRTSPAPATTWSASSTRSTTWAIPPARRATSARRSPPTGRGCWSSRWPASRLDDNVNPVGRIFYAASTFICTPAAQAQPGGYALGAQVPEATLAELAADAGFSRFRRATETPFNRVFEARP